MEVRFLFLCAVYAVNLSSEDEDVLFSAISMYRLSVCQSAASVHFSVSLIPVPGGTPDSDRINMLA